MPTEFQKALHQVEGRSFKTMSSLPPARSTRASLTSTTDDPCTDSSRGYKQTNFNTSRNVPQCSITSDLGGNNSLMETGICSHLREHIESNVDSYIPETGDKGESLDVTADNLGGNSHSTMLAETIFHRSRRLIALDRT